MRYVRTNFEPTREQLDGIEAESFDATLIGQAGFFFVRFDDERHDLPGWLVGDVVNIPGEPHRCECGRLI